MSDLVKNSIEARKNAFYSIYEITSEMDNEINDLFSKIYDFAKDIDDVNEFETIFQSSELNTSYINLFTKVSQNCKQKEVTTEESVVSDSEYKETSDLEYIAREATQPFRRKAREEATSIARGLPIIGDALEIKQHADLLNKYTGGNK